MIMVMEGYAIASTVLGSQGQVQVSGASWLR